MFAEWSIALLGGADRAILAYFLVLNSVYALLLILSIPELWKHWQQTNEQDLSRFLNSGAPPPISLLVPAYDMEATIVESVRSHLSLQYPEHEVIVINDGSGDRTMAVMRETFDLYEIPPVVPRRLPTRRVRGYYRSRSQAGLLVIDKENGGKADALNAGLSAARYPLVVAADADTLIEADALVRLARTFLSGRPVVAAGGTIRVANGCTIRGSRVSEARLPRNFLAAVQVPEYLRAFLFGRLGWNRLGGNLIVSGAFGLFRREHLMDIGGYATDNVVEDLDLVVRLHRHLRERGVEYSIPFIPDPVAWTEVPSDLRTLGRQRERWHRGLIQTLIRHRDLLFNPRYGRVGMVLIPFFVFGEMLAPLIEVFGYVLLLLGLTFGIVNSDFMGLFLAVAIGYQVLLTIWAVLLEEATFRYYRRSKDLARMILLSFLEPLGYRQLTVLWRVRAFWNTLRGRRDWGVMRRTGFERGKEAHDVAA